MSASVWLLAAHIVVFAAWFGTDLATFSMSRRVLDRGIDVPTRQVLARSMLSIEVIARLCLPAMLGLGLALYALDWSSWSDAAAWGALGAAALWVALVWSIHHRGGTELGSTLARVDLVVRIGVCAAMWISGVWSLAVDDGPFAPRWLAIKVVLFAAIMTSGIAIRFALRPFAAAFAELVALGSSDAREQAVATSLRRAQPLVGVIWVSLLAALVVAVAGMKGVVFE